MRISELKQLTDKPKARNILTYLWDRPEFHEVMSNYRTDTGDIDGLYKQIVEVFVRLLDSDDMTTSEKKGLRADIRRLSDELYGNRSYWTIGSIYEESEEPQKSKSSEKEIALQARHNNFEKLELLRERLSLKPIKKRYDLLYAIARDDELSGRVIAELDSIDSREDLREICESILIERIKSDSYTYPDYMILCDLSVLTYGDRYKWVEQNGIDPEKVRSRFPALKEQ